MKKIEIMKESIAEEHKSNAAIIYRYIIIGFTIGILMLCGVVLY